MKRCRLTLPRFIPALALAAALAWPGFAEAQDAHIYENTEQGFRIRIPQGWQTRPERTEEYFRLSASAPHSRTGLHVWVRENRRDLALDQLIQVWEDSARGNSPLFQDLQPGQPFPALSIDDSGARMVFREYTGVVEKVSFRTYAGYAVKGQRGYVAIVYFPEGKPGLERQARRTLLSFLYAAAPPPPAATGYRTLREDNFGFILDIPSDWTYRLTEDRDYSITGPAGTAAGEVTVILQFISKSGNPGSSAAAQLADARRQLTGGGASIDREGEIEVAGGSTPFLVASLDAADAGGRTVPHGYILVVLDHGDSYTWITYSGPAKAYESNGPVFQKMIDSFRFLR